jgi:hypothetical protein
LATAHPRETGMDRAADNHYPTSTTEIIAARPVETMPLRIAFCSCGLQCRFVDVAKITLPSFVWKGRLLGREFEFALGAFLGFGCPLLDIVSGLRLTHAGNLADLSRR